MNRQNFHVERTNAVNFSITLYNTLLQNGNRLPANCVLEPRRNNSQTVVVSFTCDNGHTGSVVLFDPNWTNGGVVQPQIGYVSMLCSVDRFNGYFMEICAENIDQMFEIMQTAARDSMSLNQSISPRKSNEKFTLLITLITVRGMYE
jgi:hypothetical protein